MLIIIINNKHEIYIYQKNITYGIVNYHIIWIKKKSIVFSKTFSLYYVLTSSISVIIRKPNYFFHDLKYLIF